MPYTVRGEARFIPLFYFEGETDKVQLNRYGFCPEPFALCPCKISSSVPLDLFSCLAEGWDLSYLKFCFKVQGIRGDLYQGESCKVRMATVSFITGQYHLQNCHYCHHHHSL